MILILWESSKNNPFVQNELDPQYHVYLNSSWL